MSAAHEAPPDVVGLESALLVEALLAGSPGRTGPRRRPRADRGDAPGGRAPGDDAEAGRPPGVTDRNARDAGDAGDSPIDTDAQARACPTCGAPRAERTGAAGPGARPDATRAACPWCRAGRAWASRAPSTLASLADAVDLVAQGLRAAADALRVDADPDPPAGRPTPNSHRTEHGHTHPHPGDPARPADEGNVR
ncbi:hypothetical protein [Agilicoccus flavus]|uniref:hypothetical protein n=1 Tax=Agilicoccus flavus TaxID=2775968 RepID=UPI001CF6A628|nr:hypothetical protein [Agilicoccus flavus]